jgi:hypothetical protein
MFKKEGHCLLDFAFFHDVADRLFEVCSLSLRGYEMIFSREINFLLCWIMSFSFSKHWFMASQVSQENKKQLFSTLIRSDDCARLKLTANLPPFFLQQYVPLGGVITPSLLSSTQK